MHVYINGSLVPQKTHHMHGYTVLLCSQTQFHYFHLQHYVFMKQKISCRENVEHVAISTSTFTNIGHVLQICHHTMLNSFIILNTLWQFMYKNEPV